MPLCRRTLYSRPVQSDSIAGLCVVGQFLLLVVPAVNKCHNQSGIQSRKQCT